MLLKKWLIFFTSLISILVLAFYLSPFIAFKYVEASDAELVVVHQNVLKYNHQYEAVAKALNNSAADIITLVETDILWTEEMLVLLEETYPYYFTFPYIDCCYGASVFSKHPISNLDVLYFDDYPLLICQIQKNYEKIQLIIAHAPSPIFTKRWKSREKYIHNLANYVEDLEGITIVCGDFNAVPWESSILNLLEQTNLKDSRLSYQPTFPSTLPFMKIPLDYIFYSGNIQNLGMDVIKGTGSDHYGIRTKFKFKSDV